MEEQEELISSLRKDYDALQSDMSRLQSDNDAAKDEVKEVLQVIETIDPKLKMLTELLNSDIDVNIDIKLITLLSTRTFQFFTLFCVQALEELAMNYDQKSQEVDSKNKENESLSEQLSEKLNSLNNIEVHFHPIPTWFLLRLNRSALLHQARTYGSRSRRIKNRLNLFEHFKALFNLFYSYFNALLVFDT